LLANEDAGSVVEGKKSEKLQTELQTGRRDQVHACAKATIKGRD
jgi:hypothetical protein